MAKPQRENGHIDIANELAEAFAKKRISGEEWQILWVILRQTWGWIQNPGSLEKKKMDRISLTQFSKKTGIPRPRCVRVINKLLKKNIIRKSRPKKGNTKFVTYGIQKDYDKWKVLPKKVAPKRVAPKGVKGSPQNRNKGSPQNRTNKRNNKETNTKESTSKESQKIGSQAKNTLGYFGGKYKNLTGFTYHANFKKEISLLKKALQTVPMKRLLDLIDIFFEKAKDGEWVADKVEIGVFYTQINKLQIQLSKEKEAINEN